MTAQKSVTFAADADYRPAEDCTGENVDMDPALAQRLFETGANLILLDVPQNTEVGIDVQSWRTGPQFRGIKMIPPGLHFVYYSCVSKQGSVGPRTGFFHHFVQKEVLVKRFDAQNEEIVDVQQEEVERFKSNLQSLDGHLGAYPYPSWKKWVSWTDKISPDTVARLEPMSGKINSVTELLPNSEERGNDSSETQRPLSDTHEDNLLPNMKPNPKCSIRYTKIPRKKYPSGATPAEITRHSMDSSHQLETFITQFKRLYGDQVSSSMSDRNQIHEVLGELQFSFVCFLVGQHYDSFEQWKHLLEMLCTCEEAMLKYPDLYLTLISDMHFQIREVPDDFFADIVSCNNFLVTVLNRMFSHVRNNDQMDKRLQSKVEKFQANLSQKFNWVFDDEEDEEDQPVIVENVE